MAVFSLTPVYSVPSPSPVPQSEYSEDPRLRTSSRVQRTGRVTGQLLAILLKTLFNIFLSASALSQRSRPESPCVVSIPSKYRTVFYQLSQNKGFQMQSPRFDSNRFSVSIHCYITVTVNSRYNEVPGTCKSLRYIRIFVISG